MITTLSPAVIGLAALGGYLLGSIPFGVLAARFGGIGDIRNIGSGNIGATNVLRSGRKDLALITLVGDAGKGAIAVFLAWLATRHASKDVQGVLTSVAGGAAFFGHLFSVFLKFKGGKGVATFLGTLLAAAWPVGLLCAATWLAIAFVFRISSLAALTMVALAPLYAIANHRYPVAVAALLMGILVYVRHHENIRRLLKGEEPRIGAKKDKDAA